MCFFSVLPPVLDVHGLVRMDSMFQEKGRSLANYVSNVVFTVYIISQLQIFCIHTFWVQFRSVLLFHPFLFSFNLAMLEVVTLNIAN